MAYGVRLHVWGERACFTRPEMKVERVSYDVMTPSAARGILEAVHWKPAIRWVMDRIHVLKPIRFQSFRRNEVGAKISSVTAERAMRAGSTAGLGLVVEDNRQQRAATLLVERRLRHRGAFRVDRGSEGRRHHGQASEHVQPPRRERPVLSPAVPRHPRVRGRFRADRRG